MCNQHCCYCYLGDRICSNVLLSLLDLQKSLADINNHYTITRIDIFGGEVSLLDDKYLFELKSICEKYTTHISVTTNLSRDISHIFNHISISLNEERDDFKLILSKLPLLSYDFSLSVVILPSIVKLFKSGKIRNVLSLIPTNCKSANLIKYSPSIASNCNIIVNDDDYEYVIFEAYKLYKSDILNFQIQNVEDILSKQYSPLMSENIFILPNGEYAWIEFQNQKEFFKTSYNLNEYANAVNAEYNLYEKKCKSCKYFQKCYTEHLDLNIKCSGHKHLLNKIYADSIFKVDKSM